MRCTKEFARKATVPRKSQGACTVPVGSCTANENPGFHSAILSDQRLVSSHSRRVNGILWSESCRKETICGKHDAHVAGRGNADLC